MYVTLLAGEKTIINTRYHFKRRGHWIYFDFYAIINCILYDHLHIVYCHCKLYQQFQLDAFLCTTYCYHFIIVICHNSSTMIIRNPLHVLVIFGFVLILIRKISFQLNGNSIAMHCLLSGILFYCRRETFESALILISSIASTTWSIFDE